MRTTPRIRRSPAVLAAVAVATATLGLAIPATAAATGPWPTWDGVATGEFRSATVDDGEWIWTNTVQLARGANADGLHHEDYWGLLATGGGTFPYDERVTIERHLTWSAFGVDRWATDGDQELPLDGEAWPAFTGELRGLRLAADDDEVFVRFEWVSMPAPDAQIATLAFLPDGPAVGGVAWPHGADVTSPWAVALTTWGTGATLTSSAAPDDNLDVAGLGGAVRVTDHAVEVRVPRSALPDGPWRLWGGGGLADPADPSRYWPVPAGSATATAPGSGSSLAAGSPVWSLLFADDDPWIFTSRSEGDLLVEGVVDGASVVVDPVVLQPGVDVAAPPRSGWLSRTYASAFDFGDGITKGPPGPLPGPFVLPPEVPLDEAARSYEYTGRHQPYGMYVPAAYHQRPAGEPWPLVVYLHGLNNYYYEPYGTLFNLPEVADERGHLFATLLGRGDLSYRGRGELDVMEALADIQRHYDVDPDRIHLMGHSMGSIGSHNVATRNPDRFASAAPAQITASDDLVVNLRHVPWMMVGGFEDFLDAGSNSEFTTYGIMSELGYDVTFRNYLLKTHESTSISDTLPQMFDLFERTRLVREPGEFTYRRLPGDDHPELGLVHDGAYQVDDLVFADEAAVQEVRVTSYAIPHAPLDPAGATRTDEVVDDGGPSGRSVAQKLVTTPAFGAPVEVRNAARLELDNVASASFDVEGLRLAFVPGLEVEVATTDAVALRFAGVGADVPGLRLDGAPVSGRVGPGGDLVVDVPAGEHVLTIAAGATPAPPPAPAPLPVTGGGLAALGALALLAARAGRDRGAR